MNILIVDDHAIMRDGLKRLLTTLPARETCEASTGRDALALARKLKLDLVILDLNLPDLGGLELLKRMRQATAAPVLVLTMHAEPLYLKRALDAGAHGYVSKAASPDELLTAIRRVAAGRRYVESDLAQSLVLMGDRATGPLDELTARDLEILRLLANGRSLTQIADALALSYKTVANQCTQIKAKLGAARLADLVLIAIEAGLT